MFKPDFGDVGLRIEWNSDRVAWVRHLAEDKRKSAREIALDIGLSANQAPRIFELCKRCNIQLSGQAGRSPKPGDARIYRVGIQGDKVGLLDRLAGRHSMAPAKIAELILNAAIETGEPFCENLLDLDAGQ